jgi:hypothetical protein
MAFVQTYNQSLPYLKVGALFKETLTRDFYGSDIIFITRRPGLFPCFIGPKAALKLLMYLNFTDSSDTDFYHSWA